MRRSALGVFRGAAARATAARVLALCLVLAAPIAPPLHEDGQGRSVVYVVDRSRSVGRAGLSEAESFVRRAAEVRPGAAALGVVLFAERSELAVPVGGDLGALGGLAVDEGRGSDLAGAIRLAVAALPEAGERRIVLLSDGRPTAGDPVEEVRRARERGVLVDAVPIGTSAPEGASLRPVRLEHDRLAEGEPLLATATVLGVPGRPLRVLWSRDGVPLRAEAVSPDERGEASTSLTDAAPPSGAHVYEASLLEEGSDGPPLDTSRALAIVEGRPSVLVLTSMDERPSLLLGALNHAEATVELRSLDGFAVDEAALAEVDLVVLSDVAVSRRGEVTLLTGLDPEAQQALVRYVGRRGGGLLVTGGFFGFGPEYAGTPLARLLPVEVRDHGELHDPRIAMAVMLDRSGSMAAWSGGQSKLQLAVEATLAAASTLRIDDRVAIAAVDESTTWYFPLGPAAGLPAAQSRVRSIRANGGGIFVYTALVDAYAVLRRAPEPIHHVILFSDTSDSEEQFQGCPFNPCDGGQPSALALARNALATGITTSVVGIGNAHDMDTPFLRQLASAGGGRFYLTAAGTDLRRIFISETRVATRSNLREERVRFREAGAHPALVGVDLEAMPEASGFVETDRRATADTALVTPDGLPVMASWRYGLGTVTAWTSDTGERWNAGWAGWEGAGQMLRQLLRFTMRRRSGVGAEATVAFRGSEVEVQIEVPEAEGGGEGAAPVGVELFEVGPSGSRTPVEASLERVAPGRWLSRARTGGGDFVHVRVLDRDGRLLAESVAAQQAESELAGDGPDGRAVAELARVGGGMVSPAPAQTLRGGGPRGSVPVPTWPWLLVAAAALVASDLWLRRIGRARTRRLAEVLAPLRDGPLGPKKPEPESPAEAA